MHPYQQVRHTYVQLRVVASVRRRCGKRHIDDAWVAVATFGPKAHPEHTGQAEAGWLWGRSVGGGFPMRANLQPCRTTAVYLPSSATHSIFFAHYASRVLHDRHFNSTMLHNQHTHARARAPTVGQPCRVPT